VERGRVAGWGGKKEVGHGWAKIGARPNSSNKTYLNFLQLWKFVQGDLEGILTWEFFLNSLRLLKDFRKI
jgi:hypothetical protein